MKKSKKPKVQYKYYYPYEALIVDMHRRVTKSEMERDDTKRMDRIRACMKAEDDARIKKLAKELKAQNKKIITGVETRRSRDNQFYLFI